VIGGSTATRAGELASNVRLAATVSAAALAQDPLLFTVQVGRRLPPAVVTVLAGALRAGPARTDDPRAAVRHACAAWLTGDVRGVGAHLAAARPRTTPSRRLAAELAGQLGDRDLVARLHPGARPAVHARAAWGSGDLSTALDVLGTAAGPLPGRWRAELAALRGTVAPSVRVAARRRQVPPGGPAAFHVLTNSLPHTHSGYTSRTHAVLAAQVATGVRVEAATRLAYPVSVGVLAAAHRDVVDGLTYRRLLPGRIAPTLPARLQQQADLLAPAVAAFAPTVLHTTTDWTNGVVTGAVARALGIPWVYEVRGSLEDTWAAGRGTAGARRAAAASERHRLLRDRETAVARSADHVVTLSRTQADDLVARGVDPARLTVVPNGVDPALLRTDLTAPRARESLGLPAEGVWVGTVSSLVDYEGLDTLLDAVALLRADGLDVRACLVGDGVARRSLERHAARLGLGPHAAFPGRVGRDDAVLHHQALDVFAVPRRDVRVCRVVTPLKPVEAMACRRPVVASDLPALAEVVSEPGSGVLAPAGDAPAWATALRALAEDPDLRASLGEAGRSFAAGRTWQTAGQTYRRLYERLGAGR
jgi:D-inositol-3-phosphate glycosyltransferase